MLFYVVIVSRYIQIIQKDILDDFVALNSKTLANVFYNSKHWSEYMHLNGRVCRACILIKEYGRYWSSFLTILMLGHMASVCYMLYICFFMDNISVMLRFVLYPITLNTMTALFLVTAQCAKVVKYNQKIIKQNKTFYMNICSTLHLKHMDKLLKVKQREYYC